MGVWESTVQKTRKLLEGTIRIVLVQRYMNMDGLELQGVYRRTGNSFQVVSIPVEEERLKARTLSIPIISSMRIHIDTEG
jgi:hypothetical protein